MSQDNAGAVSGATQICFTFELAPLGLWQRVKRWFSV